MILQFLLQNQEELSLKRGILVTAFQQFETSQATIKRIWKRVKDSIAYDMAPINSVQEKRKLWPENNRTSTTAGHNKEYPV